MASQGYTSVQFRDKAHVVRAYVSRGTAPFSIRQGSNQMLFTFTKDDIDEGALTLEAYLDLLYDSETEATYTLCVYEELDNNRITNKTAYDASFNFRFSEYGNPRGHNYNSKSEDKELTSRLSAIEIQLQKLGEKEAVGEEDSLGAIGRFLDHPVLGPIIGQVAQGLIDKFMPNGQQGLPDANTNQLRQVSGINSGSVEVETAYEELCKRVNDFPELLIKLSVLSITKPVQFGVYSMMLRKMKV